MLGWPDEQWECLGGWVHGSQQAAFTKDPVAGKALANLFSEHVKTNLHNCRTSPAGVPNATDALMNTEVDGVRLDDDQIVSLLRNWTAGHGTVAVSLGILALHLSDDIDLQNRLRSDPLLIPATIHLERALRVIPMGRKNWNFCWTKIGAEHVGIIQSLLVTCKLHGVNPYVYLVDVLQRISTHPASRAEELTPREWQQRFSNCPLSSDLERLASG